MENITITLENGEKKEFPKNTTYYEISKGFNMDNNILGVKINHELFSLSDLATESAQITFIDVNDLTGNKIYKSGLEFIFEVALKEVFPDLDINYQHSVPKGVLGEIVGNKILTQEDLRKIKSVMARIVSDNIPFKKYTVKKS